MFCSMEEESGISAIDIIPIEIISNNDSAVLVNDEIRFSNPKKVRSPRQISEGVRNLTENRPKTTIKLNQVGIDVPAIDDTTNDLNRKHQDNVQSTWDSEKTWHENNALAR